MLIQVHAHFLGFPMLHQEPTSSVYIANYFSLTWTSTYHPLLRSLSLSQAEGKDGAGGTQAAEPVEPPLVPTVLIPAPEPVLEAA